MNKKWINDKTLNWYQVAIYVIVIGVYAFSIKFTSLAEIRSTLLLIGAVLTVGIIIVRFTLVDRLAKKG